MADRLGKYLRHFSSQQVRGLPRSDCWIDEGETSCGSNQSSGQTTRVASSDAEVPSATDLIPGPFINSDFVNNLIFSASFERILILFGYATVLHVQHYLLKDVSLALTIPFRQNTPMIPWP